MNLQLYKALCGLTGSLALVSFDSRSDPLRYTRKQIEQAVIYGEGDVLPVPFCTSQTLKTRALIHQLQLKTHLSKFHHSRIIDEH